MCEGMLAGAHFVCFHVRVKSSETESVCLNVCYDASVKVHVCGRVCECVSAYVIGL